MAYKLYNRQVFKANINNQEYVFTCYTQDTSYGFRHICTQGFNNTMECSCIKYDIIAKACYYNRTWECWTYETVLREGISNSNYSEEVKNQLHKILIDKTSDDIAEKTQKDIEEFENLWNGLSEENKQHVKNGLGDNLITSEEQANAVVGVMKMMTVFQNLGV